MRHEVTLQSRERAGVMAIIFYIMGALGLAGAILLLLTLQFLAATTILGSALFCFGIGSIIDLLQRIESNTRKQTSTAELPPGYEAVHNGYAFRRLDQGRIEIATVEGPRVFESWEAFHDATSRRGALKKI